MDLKRVSKDSTRQLMVEYLLWMIQRNILAPPDVFSFPIINIDNHNITLSFCDA